MSRSLYKLRGISVKRRLLVGHADELVLKKNTIFFKDSKFKKQKMHVLFWNSTSYILPTLLYKRVGVYNGHLFLNFQIRSSMLFSKVGDFVKTKKLGMAMHIIKKKKKK